MWKLFLDGPLSLPIKQLLLLMLWVCTTVSAHAMGAILLHDVTEKSEIAFVHSDGSSGHRYIAESVGAGLALFDFDGDGDAENLRW